MRSVKALTALLSGATASQNVDFLFSKDWEPLVGQYAFNITTKSEEAQRLFGVGLLLLYNFNQPFAATAFKEAVKEDEECAMCYWGLAHSYGPNLNSPTKAAEDMAAGSMAAKTAVTQLHAGHSEKERALVSSMAVRYPGDPKGDQVASYTEYSKALRNMREASPALSTDPDVMVFDAEGRMVLKCDDDGYHFYESHGDDLPPTPTEGTEAISALLYQVLNITNNTHVYAQHMLIHSTEMSNAEASTAVDQAAILMRHMQMPLQNQHLQHMSSHTFFRTGHYHEAVEANQAAVASDSAYLHHGKVPYGPGHNAVFLLSSAMFGGERSTAYKYSKVAQQIYQQAPERPDGPNGAVAWSYPMMAAVRFGDWDLVSSLDKTPPGNFSKQWPYGYGVVRSFALAVTAVRTGDMDKAEEQLKTLQGLLPEVEKVGDDGVVNASRIANHTATAVLLHSRQDLTGAVAALEAAVQQEMAMPYDEPPMWLLPSRECYGKALLDAGNFEMAEKTFRSALYGYSFHAEPNCGWALHGLRTSLQKQPSTSERQEKIKTLAEDITRAWTHSDVPLTAACSLLGSAEIIV